MCGACALTFLGSKEPLMCPKLPEAPLNPGFKGNTDLVEEMKARVLPRKSRGFDSHSLPEPRSERPRHSGRGSKHYAAFQFVCSGQVAIIRWSDPGVNAQWNRTRAGL